MFLSLSVVSFANTSDSSVNLTSEEVNKIYSDLSNVTEEDMEKALDKIDLEKHGVQEVQINEDFILVHELKVKKAQENNTMRFLSSSDDWTEEWGERSLTIKSTTWPNPKLYTLNISALFRYDGETECEVKTVNANVDIHLIGLSGTIYNIRDWTTEEDGKTWGIASAQYDITFGVSVGHIVFSYNITKD